MMRIDVEQLDSFCTRWLRKARSYDGKPYLFTSSHSINIGHNAAVEADVSDTLASCFDKFTSLYVAFNRVYTEVGKVLIAKGQVPTPRQGRYAPLPDRKAATSYVVDFYGSRRLRNEMQADESCRKAVGVLVALIENGDFYLHENYATGTPNRAEDRRIAREASGYNPKAILGLIYQARCNLFHGTKAFEEHQRVLLDNMSVILEFVTYRILKHLKRELQ